MADLLEGLGGESGGLLGAILGGFVGGGGSGGSITVRRDGETVYTGAYDYSTAGQLIADVLPLWYPTQPALPSPPSPDQPQPLPAPPTPSVQPMPTPAEAIGGIAPAQWFQTPWLPGGHFRGESGRTAKAFDEAYGLRAPLKLRKARRMARRRGTMRAQEVYTPEQMEQMRQRAGVDPRSLPVPQGENISQRDYERAMRQEGARRGDVRRAPPVEPPIRGPAPTTTRGRGVGVGVGAVFDPFELAEDFGAVVGEAVGEDRYGQTEEEIRRAARQERELAERYKREIAPFPGEITNIFGEGTGEIDFGIPPKLDKEGNPVGGMKRLRFPAPAPAPTPKTRMQRVMSAIGRAQRNPWAMAGILGLGLLGGKKKKTAAAPLSMPLPVDLGDEIEGGAATLVSPGSMPFAFAGGFGAVPPSTTAAHCDCKPKRRGPKRRCLERGTVAWRTGRYKGKNAGTKCVRWE